MDKSVATEWEEAWRLRYEPTSAEAMEAWERPYREYFEKKQAEAAEALGPVIAALAAFRP